MVVAVKAAAVAAAIMAYTILPPTTVMTAMPASRARSGSRRRSSGTSRHSKWLSNELGREATIPRNLPMQGGLTFVGGRVLYSIDGQPIGQIAYHDSEGRLTAFRFKRNPTRVADEELRQAQFFGRLQMIRWQDDVFQYALVGFTDYGTLESVATWLEDNYGEDA